MLEGVPTTIDYNALKSEISTFTDIVSINEFRLWSLDNERHIAEIHLTTTFTTLEEVEILKKSLRAILGKHGVTISTIEVKP